MVSTPRMTGFLPLPLPDRFDEATLEVVDQQMQTKEFVETRETFHQQVFGQIFAEVGKMADHLAKTLVAQEGREQEEGEFAITYEVMPEAEPDDDVHFVAWAVSDLQQFWNPEKLWSERGRNLNLGLSYREWDRFITELGRRPSSWPLLARFEDPYMDVVFKPFELRALVEECASAHEEFTEPAALGFLEKVRAASEAASAGQVALYYSAP